MAPALAISLGGLCTCVQSRGMVGRMTNDELIKRGLTLATAMDEHGSRLDADTVRRLCAALRAAETIDRATEADRAYTVAEACTRLGSVSRRTFYNLLGDGQLTARKLGSRTVVLASDLARFLGTLPLVEQGASPLDEFDTES